ncbi:MAG: Lipid-A-disaccharide synthase [Hyphomicrobiaceae bacterium hypho_1]
MTLKIFMVAGEPSGDALGAKLIDALRALSKDHIDFSGIGGEHMAARGFQSIFPFSDLAVIGPLAILYKLPHLVRRVYQTINRAIQIKPHIVIIIDSPEFTHPIAKRIRKRYPNIPIIVYVSPTVWAWRPGRARKMRSYVDHVMALLPFEPDVYARLKGPLCTYVGHPLIERQNWIQSLEPVKLAARLKLDPDAIPILLLPGSRESEIAQLLKVFGDTVSKLHGYGYKLEVLLPAVSHLRDKIIERTDDWPVSLHILEGETDKFTAFRLAHVALAASGTVTLELGITGTPMVVAYRVDKVASMFRFLMTTDTVVLANLVIGERVIPEFLQEDCHENALADALISIIKNGPARQAQLLALEKIADSLVVPNVTPSEKAAQIIMDSIK